MNPNPTTPPDELGAAACSGPSLREQLAAAQAEISRLKKITRCKREPDKTTLGGIIRTAREQAGMTLREAATKAGMAPSILSRIERDALSANPTMANLRRVADVIGKPLSSLFAEWEGQNDPALATRGLESAPENHAGDGQPSWLPAAHGSASEKSPD